MPSAGVQLPLESPACAGTPAVTFIFLEGSGDFGAAACWGLALTLLATVSQAGASRLRELYRSTLSHH